MWIHSSKKLFDNISVVELSQTFLYFFEENSLELVYIHLLIDFDHRFFIDCLQCSGKNGRIDIVLFWVKHFQE